VNILAIDPGLTYPAAAASSNGRITRAERLKVPKAWAQLAMLDRCERIGAVAASWCNVNALRPDVVIVEWPQWYGSDADNNIDPNDLAGLCGIAGAVAAHVRRLYSPHEIRILSPKPREVWGNVPKVTKGNPWRSPRGIRLASRLTADERASVQSKHDALDAAGLALFADGRWTQRRVYPGAV
jgi:hypothetical protein